MKKIILVLTVSVFAIAAQAGAPAGAAKAKDGACCDAKAACGSKTVAGKSDTKKVKIVQSPKASGQSDRAS